MFRTKPRDDEALKHLVAEHAVQILSAMPLEDMQLGIGSGSTIACFISALGKAAGRIRRPVASSSKATTSLLTKQGIDCEDNNSINALDLYLDGADEIDPHMRMLKGGGGALTGEKILAWQARSFWCLIDDSKTVDLLGSRAVAVEMVHDARSLVARALVKLGGRPEYRHGFVSDHGNPIVDVYDLDLSDPAAMEEKINNLPGVVCNGIFARTPATRLLCAYAKEDGGFAVRDSQQRGA